FGISRVVLHDGASPPKLDLGHFQILFVDGEQTANEQVGERYALASHVAVSRWAEDTASDEDVRWLSAMLKHGLLSNSYRQNHEIETLASEYRRLEGELSLPRVTPGVGDFGPGCDQPLLIRGDCRRPGEIVPQGYLEVLEPQRQAVAYPRNGRIRLA